jgi:heat shock protein HslJ
MKMVVAHGASKPLSNPDSAGKPPAQTAAKPPAQGAAKPPPPQGAPKPPPLVGTHWTLTQLGDAPVAASGSERDAHLVFASEGSRVTGSTGCNRLRGTYTRKGDALTFGPAATTKMACIGAAQETETKMLAALQATTSGKITGRSSHSRTRLAQLSRASSRSSLTGPARSGQRTAGFVTPRATL